MLARRAFMGSALGLGAAMSIFATARPPALAQGAGDRPARLALRPDPAGLFDLPDGFSYYAFSATGETMSDGLLVPAAHDGMAAFPAPGASDRLILMRNHEIGPSRTTGGAFGDTHELAGRIDPARIYDRAGDGRPLLGGVTRIVLNTRTRRIERSELALAGTATNCAGGRTPWGSWLTCEETLEQPGANARRPHGFIFETPADGRGLADPVPLTAMGRFVHEAAAVDPQTGVVYLTEDQGDGLFYRFLPETPGELARGGRLQALRIRSAAAADTRNWQGADFPAGRPAAADWVDLDRPESPDGDLKERGARLGAARFARGEGVDVAIENGRPVIYMVATSGGPARCGQVWRYEPSRFEGRPGETNEPARLTLLVDGSDPSRFEMIDNICASPHGFLVSAEDGRDDNFLRLITPGGRVFPLARNAHPDRSELCGPCFSPDGSILFVNMQRPGLTLAIEGPWAQLAGLSV